VPAIRQNPRQLYAERRAADTQRISGLDLRDATHAQIGISESDGIAHAATGSVELAEAYLALGLRNRIHSVLDIGCGKGAALIAFHRLGVQGLYGIDLSSSVIEICESNLKKLQITADVKQMNATRIDNSPNVDLIYTFNSLPRHTLGLLLDRICEHVEQNRNGLLILFSNLQDEDLIVKRSIKYILVRPKQYSVSDARH
jgi:ribosomal protein L11 methylase PrmA